MIRGRALYVARLAFVEQLRRPLLVVFLVALPFFFITRAISVTLPIPRMVGLPGGISVATTMKDVHGGVMAAITVAFLTGLWGAFTMASARASDRRLVVAGFRPAVTIAARLSVVLAAALVAVIISVAVTALSFTPASWTWFGVGTLMVALEYGAIGALAGATVGKLSAANLMFFLPMIDAGIIQNPMFGSGTPPAWAMLFPAYGPMRVVVNASFAAQQHAGPDLLLSGAWIVVLALAVAIVLRSAMATSR
jgi:hypothetical protein